MFTQQALTKRCHDCCLFCISAFVACWTAQPVIAAEPANDLDAFQVAPGFRVELVAAEPLLRDPVAIAFDEFGRLFVVEFPEYNQQFSTDRKKPRGAVRMLEDTDGDGRFDKSTVYISDIASPSALACYDGGLFVAAAPDLLFFKDTDGDGRADQRKVVFTGFVRMENRTDPSLNSILWGLDNRFHACTSYSGSVVRNVVHKDAKPRSIHNRGFLFDPRSLRFDLSSGGGQHGLAMDDWGREFLCMNSSPVRMLMYDDRYVARNPFLKAPPPAVEISDGGKHTKLFRISPDEPWRVERTRLRNEGKFRGSNEGGKPSGFFTSATGVTIYRGDAWPAEYRGSVFVGEPANNLVFRSKLEPNAVGFIARRADPKAEFLASTDTSFRPVQFANAPDGNPYVIDMNRELIEGAMFLPTDVLKTVDVSGGVQRGRIYRIVTDEFIQRARPMPGKATTAELVAMLEHRNGWHRDTASRLLYERQDRSAIKPLRKLAAESRFPIARVTAMYSLLGLDALDDQIILQALEHPVSEVRVHATRLAEGWLDSSPALQDRLIKLADDADLLVRYQVAFSLGELGNVAENVSIRDKAEVSRLQLRSDALAKLAIRDGRDQWMRLAVLSSVVDCAGQVFGRLAKDEKFRKTSHGRDMLVSLSRQIGAADRKSDVAAVVNRVNTWPSSEGALSEAVAVALFSGNKSAAGRGLENILDGMLKRAKTKAVDASAKEGDRLEAIRTLQFSQFVDSKAVFVTLIEPKQSSAIQSAVIETLAQFESAEVAELLLNRWSNLTPTLRARAVETLLTRADWSTVFLDAIEKGGVGRGDLDPARIELLKEHPNKKIASRVEKLFAGASLQRREQIVREYQPVLKLQGDVARGKQVFKKVCSACHRLEGVGTAVGADLKAIRDRGKPAVLLNILDPNRDVKPQYLSYSLVTDDGRVLAGMIAGESVNSITIRRPDGTQTTILRVNIEELRSTGLSFMPEGLEKQINQQSMADLFAYLMSQSKADSTSVQRAEWKAGVAKTTITPQQPMWMSGYRLRDKPADGKVHDLYAKALVLEDDTGHRVALITADIVGIDRSFSVDVCQRLSEQYKLRRADIAICTSHTHSGPVVGDVLAPQRKLNEEQQRLVDDYEVALKNKLVDLVGDALKDVAPGGVAWGTGTADFAVNRRENRESKVPQLRASGQLKGPVDHDVPVLKVADRQGKIVAIVFGYACHATVTRQFQWSGDYPGFAQQYVEKDFPEAVAMFWAGCGADQNPLPRRKIELADAYGRRLADAVIQVISAEMKPIAGRVATNYHEIALPMQKLPTVEALIEASRSTDSKTANWARVVLRRMNRGGGLKQEYPYPVQTWHLGNGPTFIALGGEVVVDYSLRLKSDLGASTWVAGYANDVMNYIPSRRVWAEGGYEGSTAMYIYGRPARWTPEIERLIITEIKRQTAKIKSFNGKPKASVSP